LEIQLAKEIELGISKAKVNAQAVSATSEALLLTSGRNALKSAAKNTAIPEARMMRFVKK